MSAPIESAASTVAPSQVFPCVFPFQDVPGKKVGLLKGFSDHMIVANAKALFHTVELESVTVTMVQITSSPSSASFVGENFSFGIAPRDITLKASGGSVVGFIPHLELFRTTAAGTTRVVKWGLGGLPFPPAIQLDLTSAEVKSKYPVVLVGPHELPDANDDDVVSVRVEFTVRCTGAGFGSPM